jgi:type III pantothenate kinase
VAEKEVFIMDEKSKVSEQEISDGFNKLIIDIGNTFVKIAVFQNVELIFQETTHKLTLQKIQELEENYQFRNVIISSVAELPAGIREFLEAQYSLIELDQYTPVPIINLYKSPDTLGKDRLAAVVAATWLHPAQNCLVIDAGTCITFDLIDKDKKYHGGSISPGMQLRFKALNTFTSRLPLVTHRNFKGLVGTTTEESIQSGVINGIVFEMNGIIDRYKADFRSLKVLLTGGDMNFFAEKLKNGIFAVPNLVLIGLNEILNYNFEKR